MYLAKCHSRVGLIEIKTQLSAGIYDNRKAINLPGRMGT